MNKLSIDALPYLQVALQALIDPAYVVDSEFNVLWANESYRQAFRFRPRKKRKCHEIAKMDICGNDSCLLQRCKRSGSATRFQEASVGGSQERDATCLAGGFPLYDAELENIVAVVGILRDNSAEVRLHKRYGEMLEAERNRKELLEKMVSERTAELQNANLTLNIANSNLHSSRQEIADILENISQAIMTIDSSCTIGREYSSFSEALFAQQQLNGRNFIDLLSSGNSDSKESKDLMEWLKLVFNSPGLDWEMAKTMAQPEYMLKRPDGSVAELKVDFEPIREDDNRIKRLMVLVQDLTEKRALQRTIDAKEKEMSDSIEHLAEIARLDPEMYEAILDEAFDIIARAFQSLSTLRDSPDSERIIDGMFRDMHTLKGNAMSFGMVRVAAKAHWVEDAFEDLRENVGDLTPAIITDTEEKLGELRDLFERIQQMATLVLDQGGRKDIGEIRPPNRKSKVEIKQERLEDLASWAMAHFGQNELTEQLVARIKNLGLVPLGKLFNRFPKMVSDLAETLGKRMNPVDIQGEDDALGSYVFNRLANIYVHLIRNSVDHGIEKPERRVELGKPAAGTIWLSSRFEGDKFHFAVRDDGAGMDPEKLIARAIEKGLLDKGEEPPTGQEAFQLIFRPGFSTAETVSDTSGRGVGMDAVKAILDELRGDITIETTIGKGTTFSMWIPAAVATGYTGKEEIEELGSSV